ncbi:MAG: MerR family transcriptional regulator [Proteobacteria bacterium]|nr:MerR family transcriptional regulator [Pseudomonadota bacterium]MBU1710756.1 MerR family transcriptional regulator [Pseudomonadota bacterium]
MIIDKPIFTIGTASNILNLHPRTLRIYEKEGLFKPERKGAWRYYSMNDLNWIKCIRKMIHERGINTGAIRNLLEHMACWNIVDCPLDKREMCTAYHASHMDTKWVS